MVIVGGERFACPPCRAGLCVAWGEVRTWRVGNTDGRKNGGRQALAGALDRFRAPGGVSTRLAWAKGRRAVLKPAAWPGDCPRGRFRCGRLTRRLRLLAWPSMARCSFPARPCRRLAVQNAANRVASPASASRTLCRALAAPCLREARSPSVNASRAVPVRYRVLLRKGFRPQHSIAAKRHVLGSQ